MDVSIAEAKHRLGELIRAVESGEAVVIKTCRSAHAGPFPKGTKSSLRYDAGMNQHEAGMDRPLTMDEFLLGEF